MEVRLSDGGAGTVDLVVGADGLHSRTRGLVRPAAPQPRATGQLIRRAPAPRPPEVTRYSTLDGGPEPGEVGIVPGAPGTRHVRRHLRPGVQRPPGPGRVARRAGDPSMSLNPDTVVDTCLHPARTARTT